MAEIKREQADLTAEYKELQSNVMKVLKKIKQASTTVSGTTSRITATLVESSTVVLDHEKLRKRLGGTLWNKVSTRSLDRKKLDAAISAGEVRTSDVAACSDEQPRAPYIKITSK